MSLFGSGRLLDSNCVVDVEAYSTTQADSGATVETYAAVAKRVLVLFTLQAGGREGGFGTGAEHRRGTIAGTHSSLARSDARYKIVSYPDNPTLVGTYWRPSGTTDHPKGLGGLLEARYSNPVERVDFPTKGA